MGKAKSGYYIGFDLGGTKMRALVVDEEFRIVASAKRKAVAGVDTAAEGLDRMRACVDEALEEATVSPKDLRGIGFGLPGALDLKQGVILRLFNVGWENVPVKKKFETIYGAPVAIDNDVNAGAYGEYRFGAGRGHPYMVGIFVGTGIGGGLIIDGKIHQGVGGAVGEIGHLLYDRLGPRCGCGARGCYETYASRLAVASQAAVQAYLGKAPALAKKAGYDVEKYRSGTLAWAIENGDAAVEEIVRESARIVGHLACDLALVLCPSMIVLGGGMVEAMPKIYLEECKAALKAHPVIATMKGVAVSAVKLGDDAVPLGAAAIAADKVRNEK